MKRSTTNKLSMYQNVYTVLNNYRTAWQDIAAFAEAVTDFSVKLELLHASLVEQLNATTGVAAEKKIRITDLQERIVVVQNALLLHGQATGNRPLEERNKRTKESMRSMSMGKLGVRCGEIKQDLDDYGAELVPYGITPAMIAALVPTLVNIDQLNNSTRQAILHRMNATKAIDDLEHDIDTLIHLKMDKLLLLFKNNQPRFFETFRSARMIINYGHGNHRGGEPQPDDGHNI